MGFVFILKTVPNRSSSLRDKNWRIKSIKADPFTCDGQEVVTENCALRIRLVKI